MRGRSVPRFILLLFGLCVPVWAIGAVVDVELYVLVVVYAWGPRTLARFRLGPASR